MLQEDGLRLSLAQYDIVWEDKEANLKFIHYTIKQLKGKTDIIVFPEMCTTAFTMNSYALAESGDGNTINLLRQWTKEFQLSVCGSFIAVEEDKYYNRAFFITPEKEFYYDKRHLFRMGNESEFFSAGKNE